MPWARRESARRVVTGSARSGIGWLADHCRPLDNHSLRLYLAAKPDRRIVHTMLPQPRRNNFDGLRLIGALAVLVSHQFALADRLEPHLAPGYSLGRLGVLLFFSISGYLVYGSWVSDPDVGRFARRRLLRVWPAYAAVVILAPLLAYALVHLAHQHPFYLIRAYMRNILWIGLGSKGTFFPDLPYPFLNGSLWTLEFEVECYLVLALVLALAGARQRRRALIGLLAVCGAWIVLSGFEDGINGKNLVWSCNYLLYFGAFFAAGAALHEWTALRSERITAVALATGGTLIALGQTYIGLLILLPSAVVCVGARDWRCLSSAAHFGDLSYGIFLWAFPVQQISLALLGSKTHLGLLFAITLSVTAIFAAASAWLIERPALRLKPHHPWIDHQLGISVADRKHESLLTSPSSVTADEK
jgi:peptidoglycan/LPS O-acetylase OafA/YrhL